MSTAARVLSTIDARGVARLTLNRPEKHNAFDAETIARLHAHLIDLAHDALVRVVVITGVGPTFCAGADLEWMKHMATLDAESNLADAHALAELLATLDGLPKPTLARVQGSAFGGGVGLIACCDIAIAVNEARFALTEVRLGLVPATISPYVVAAIGPRLARRYLLTAEPINAQAAVDAQLLHEACDATLLDERIAAHVDLLLKAGPQALRECKELIAEVRAAQGSGDALRLSTAHRLARLRMSDEGRAGMRAFLDKRNPDWWPEGSGK
jgi:methylglutaconyl-CoA hydratase